MVKIFSSYMPQVSVLMSCYNAKRWLCESIESVLTQTFEDFEFIVIDDGSTDDTWGIIQNYCRQDKRVFAISKKNTGLTDSLNVGIGQARGRWIARLDSDDLCERTRLEEQVKFVRTHPEVVLLGTGCVEIDVEGQTIKKHRYPSDHKKLVDNLEHCRRFFPHSSAFYRVDETRRAGGYNVRFHRAQDCRLWMELTFWGKIACLQKPLVRIRKHSNQISLNNNGKRQLCDGVAAIICHLLKKEGYGDPSTTMAAEEWIAFLNWVENRIEALGIFEKRKIWADARSDYLEKKDRLIGAVSCGFCLLQSRHSVALMWERIFGSSLPENLAKEWVALSCTA